MSFVQSMVAYAEFKTGIKSTLFSSEHCLTTWSKASAEDRVKKIPAPGAIVIWQHGKTQNGHTGFVMEYGSKTMETVEGNTGASFRDGDGVYQKNRSISKDGDMKVVGFIIPFAIKEAKAEPVSPPDVTIDPSKLTTGQDPDEGTGPWYRRMWDACRIDAGKENQVKSTMRLIESGMARYMAVARKLGAVDIQNFAYILGVIHYKEASCNFAGVLHNGERIIGTGKKTSIVPKGRGPFATWEDAAVDAIGIESDRWKKLIKGGDNIEDILWALERYNGTGYITGAGKAETSPYLWACSNINDDKGKYVSDGKFDPNAWTNETEGAALLLKQFAMSGAFQVT